MNALTFGGELVLGEAAIDREHGEFVELVNALAVAPDAQLPSLLARFRAHAEHHFGQEDALMREGYPSAQCHLDEHAAVLNSVRQVQDLVGQGDLKVGRRLVSELARWFPEHTQAMDRGLADWVTQRRLGGSRMTFRRRESIGS